MIHIICDLWYITLRQMGLWKYEWYYYIHGNKRVLYSIMYIIVCRKKFFSIYIIRISTTPFRSFVHIWPNFRHRWWQVDWPSSVGILLSVKGYYYVPRISMFHHIFWTRNLVERILFHIFRYLIQCTIQIYKQICQYTYYIWRY